MARTRTTPMWLSFVVAYALLGGCADSTTAASGTTMRKPAANTGPSKPVEAHNQGPRDRVRPSARKLKPMVPSTVRVPSIAVEAPVIRPGLNQDGTIEVPEEWSETGWWSGGSKPGAAGPAVIVGHVDSKTGPAVFFRLRDLRPGDIIVLGSTGRSIRFEVVRLERHPKDEFPTDEVYEDARQPTLRLVTCDGDFDSGTGHYVDNLIVFARLPA